MDWTIARIPKEHAASASRPMLLYQAQICSYSEMDERSNRVAQGLIAGGLVKGDRVALLDKNGPAQFELLFGSSKAGLVTPINWRLAPAEMAYILNHSEAKIVFVGEEFVAPLAQVRGDLSADLTIIVIDANGESYECWRDAHAAKDQMVFLASDDVALQLYTSGTTGLPKGVMLTSRNLFTLLNETQALWGLDEKSVSLVCMPLFHIGGIGWALACMRHGGSIVLVREFEPASILAAIEDHKISHANFVPAMLGPLIRAARQYNSDCSSLEMILYGTAPISRPLLVDAIDTFDCRLYQAYGLTETTSAVTQLDWQDHLNEGVAAQRLLSAGRPFPWVELKIVDPQDAMPLETGQPGELWVKSAQNMKGYWRDSVASEKAQMEDGWLRTGDAGYLDQDGYLFLTDRVKDMIVSGGENIYPAEIERVLAEHPAVEESAVFAVPHESWGEAVKAAVVPRPGSQIDQTELLSWCRDRLAHFKCPNSLDVMNELPRNATGKVLKRALRDPYWKGHTRGIN